jgi:hypothetical protein
MGKTKKINRVNRKNSSKKYINKIKNKLQLNSVLFTEKPKTFIVGYGSLINTKSRLNTGKQNIGRAIPIIVKNIANLKRVWNFQKNNYNKSLTALGLQNSLKGSNINGVLYPVFSNISDFDERETGYYRLRLNIDKLKAINKDLLPRYNCDIFIYMLKPRYQKQRPNKNLPILQSYVDKVITGCLEYNIDFAKRFIKTTYGWNKYFLNDRVDQCESHKIIDSLLKEYLPKSKSCLMSKPKNKFIMLK